MRSIIARRNVTMTIMAVALAVGLGREGFWLVAAWQGATFAWHALRTAMLTIGRGERLRPEA